MTKTTKLEEASRRWGGAAVVGSQASQAARPRGLAVAFGVPPAARSRTSRVAEQIRDISQHKLDRSTNP